MAYEALRTHLQRVEIDRGEKPIVAFFDLDRTLIAGYSLVALARERIRHGLNRGEFRESLAILQALLRQNRSRKDVVKGPAYKRLVKRMTTSLKGISEDTLIQLGEQAFHNSIARTVYSEAISLLETHRRAGHKLVIVTAATHYQVDPIAKVLGIDEVCCTQLDVADGKFTGTVLAPVCYGEGKLMAARRLCRREGASLKTSWFYADSADDLPLLRAVGNAVAVNPSEKLGVHARAKGWPQLQFDSRGLPSLDTVLRTLLTAQTVAAATAFSVLGTRFGASKIRSANRVTRIIGEVGSGFAGIDIEIEGVENLSKERPAVFIYNHQSLLDSVVLAHLLREDVVALVKKELANIPLVGSLLRQADTIFVDREDSNQAEVLKQALAVLGEGRSLVIAPEGTRSTLGAIQPFKHGAFYLAKKAGVPIIPIVLHNVKDALPNGGLFIRPTTIRVTILPAIHPKQMGGIRRACESMEQSYSNILGSSKVAALPYRPGKAA